MLDKNQNCNMKNIINYLFFYILHLFQSVLNIASERSWYEWMEIPEVYE